MPPFRLTPQQPTEDAEQILLARWLDTRRIRFCHVPNGGARDKITGARLKAAGVKRGVPDLLIFDRPPKHPDLCGAAIELKRRDGGVLSSEQVDWLEALAERGWLAACCRGWEHAVEVLQAAGYGIRGGHRTESPRVAAVLGFGQAGGGDARG